MKATINFLTKLRDACSMIAESCQDELLLLNPTHGKSFSKVERIGLEINPNPLNDPDKIEWVKATGQKGPYERYPDFNMEPELTIEYNVLLLSIERHDGKYSHNGLFYWIFQDEKTIGRKVSKRGIR